jgi:hypothetical protein
LSLVEDLGDRDQLLTLLVEVEVLEAFCKVLSA